MRFFKYIDIIPERPIIDGVEGEFKNGDEIKVRKGSPGSYRFEVFKVASDGSFSPSSITAVEWDKLAQISQTEITKLSGLKTQSEIDSEIEAVKGYTDEQVKQTVAETIPISGTVLPRGSQVPAWVVTRGKATLYGRTGGTTYTNTGTTPTSFLIPEGYLLDVFYTKTTDVWQGDVANVVKLPSGKDGKTTEPFNAAKAGGYPAGDQVYYGENKIYSALVNVPMGESPTTNPTKWKIELGESLDNLVKSNLNLFDPRNIKTGYYAASGNFNANVGYNHIRIYEGIKASTKYIITRFKNLSTNFNFIHFWNGTTWLGKVDFPRFDNNPLKFTFETPATCDNITINVAGYTEDMRIMLQEGTVVNGYVPYRILEFGVKKDELATLVENDMLITSAKNKFEGQVITKKATAPTGVQFTSSDNDIITHIIPVTLGTYIISGYDMILLTGSTLHIIALSSDEFLTFHSSLGLLRPNSTTIVINDPTIKGIVFPLVKNGAGLLSDVKRLKIQVETGSVKTAYEAFKTFKYAEPSSSSVQYNDKLTAFIPFNVVNTSYNMIELTPIVGGIAPLGALSSITGEMGKIKSNTVFGSVKNIKPGSKNIIAHLMSYNTARAVLLNKGKVTPFTVPSGALDNSPTIANYENQYPLANYTHPSIGYSSTGVAGYKYWMVNSVYPLRSLGDATWEDEEVFVSNDAVIWKRVKSLYEDVKSYTATGLSLPPVPSTWSNNARRNCFLPVPQLGAQIEVSFPADNGGPAADRKIVTITGQPFKHDPCILLDGGYVYIYHSFHLSHDGGGSGDYRFVVLTRSSNGVNWECVRADGSTLALDSESATNSIFTKDAQGRYNYLNYAYKRSRSNPEVLKYADGDYELVYGYNFVVRYKGTTPWNFDFGTTYPFQDLGSGNHPGLLLNGTDLYLLGSKGFYKSTNRGVNFEKLPVFPSWLGGFDGMSYKKAMCRGEGGKVIVVDTYRPSNISPAIGSVNNFITDHSYHNTILQEYSSVSELLTATETSNNEAYIDVQLEKINLLTSTRYSRVYQKIGLTKTTTLANTPMLLLSLDNINIEDGDELFFYVTLTVKNLGVIQFGGIEIR